MGTVVSGGVAESLIRTTEWSRLRESCGTAAGVGMALSALLSAESPDAIDDQYWRIENHVVVQGELYESAEACCAVLVAAFADERPHFVRIAALELLFQILRGYGSDTPGTPTDILERCQRAVREGLWGIVREAIRGHQEGAWEVLELAGLGDRLGRLRVEVQRARAHLDSRLP